jgi:hypothetical protein
VIRLRAGSSWWVLRTRSRSWPKLKVARELTAGEEFGYTFDLGDDWRHRCRIEEKIDPHLLFDAGDLPREPVVIWGWGWIPDQYGRLGAEG